MKGCRTLLRQNALTPQHAGESCASGVSALRPPALDEPHLHALLQLALLPAAAFAAPSAAAVLGCDTAHTRTRAVLRAMAASGFLEVSMQVFSYSRSLNVALRAT